MITFVNACIHFSQLFQNGVFRKFFGVLFFTIKMAERYKLYVINSLDRIDDILIFFKDLSLKRGDVGPIRKDYTRNSITGEYIAKDRKLAILDTAFYEKLKALGYGEEGIFSGKMEIIPYQISSEDYAHRRSSVMHFYFPIDPTKDNVATLQYKMEYYTKMRLIGEDDWYIHPIGICEFSPNVKDIIKVIIKLMVDIPTDFRVSWCRHGLFSRTGSHFKQSDILPSTEEKQEN